MFDEKIERNGYLLVFAVRKVFNAITIMDEQLLVQAAIRGDEQAYSVLVRKYSLRLLNYVRKKTRDADASEDIVQEAFIRAYQLRHRCTRPEGFGSWLFEITRNCLREWYRSRKQLQKVVDSLTEEKEYNEFVYEKDDSEIWSDALEKSLSKLPDELRRILIMKFEHGMTCNEIAEVLQRTVNTVTKDLSRAYQELKKIMKLSVEGGL